jgi:hypothetical protein
MCLAIHKQLFLNEIYSMVTKDERVEIARLQSEIKDTLGLNTENIVFEYSSLGNKIKLDLITVNPRHNQSFLFQTTEGVDKRDALEKMVDYLKKNYKTDNSYTVQWTKHGDNELHTSYFRAKNMYDALDKLYYGRDMNTISVYIIKLNPIS